MEAVENSGEVALSYRLGSPKPPRKHRATKPQLLSRSQIDRRTNAARTFDRLVTSIESDLGGHDQLTAIEIALIEALSGSYVLLDNLNTRLLLGKEIDLSEHAATVSAIVRVSSRLGLRRRAKDITPPSVAEYLAHMVKQKEGAAS